MTEAAALNPPESRIEPEVRRVRALLEKSRYSAALSAAEAMLPAAPENRDILYLIAVSQRYLHRIPDALATLERFEAIHPDYGRLFQERGHCYRTLGDAAAAIGAYEHAVALNAALPASWNALHALYLAAGRTEEAEAAARYLGELANLPATIVTASSMFNEGEIYPAERIVRRFLLTHGNHVEAMRLLAQIGVKLDVLDDAEFLLESVVEFKPHYDLARYEYALVLTQRHKHAKALEQAKQLLSIEPRNRAYRTLYAGACVGLGDHEEALRIFRELAAETPNAADLHLSIAHALKTLGRQREAIASYQTAASVNPSFGDAYWSLANLKTYRFADEDIARMRSEEAMPSIKLADRFQLCFALGKALEDHGEYAESFRYYERGNALKKAESRYNADVMALTLRRQMSVCTPEFFASRTGVGCERADPIFVVGLPRAGSTLIEQILASHSQVEGTMELAEIPRLVQQLQGREHVDARPRYPSILTELSADQFKRFGEKYLADTQVYRTGRAFFIDKMPNNFRHIGLIHLMLPNAKIIDARRAPVACCFSNFKQLFASGQEFTYDLEDIARYYRDYLELMAHWDRALPGKVLRVQHEQVVEDLEGNVRRLLDFCGLEFEPACLEFFKTERSVRTASSEQVRQPIYRDGIDQWRHFEPWLGRLHAALHPSSAAEQPR
ncbi:MAG: tetratricopeptide repeat-containing sulfotransferase family protein [Steroidobacteraceae bacterium]|jgi:tetratricopeptide (TPR) repeat protein